MCMFARALPSILRGLSDGHFINTLYPTSTTFKFRIRKSVNLFAVSLVQCLKWHSCVFVSKVMCAFLMQPSHILLRHTCDSLVTHLYAPVYQSYLPVFQLYVLLCVNPNVPICYSMLPVCTCMSLVCHLCGVLVKFHFH